MDTISQYDSKLESQIKDWFDEIISSLRLDEVLFEKDLLDKEKKELYKTLSSGNSLKIHDMAYNQAKMFFIEIMLLDYLDELRKKKAIPLRLAFDISKSKILVWAEINDDEEELEKRLILAEALVNSKYYPHGFSINSTIIEKSDNLPIPSHYKTINK